MQREATVLSSSALRSGKVQKSFERCAFACHTIVFCIGIELHKKNQNLKELLMTAISKVAPLFNDLEEHLSHAEAT